MKIPPKVLKHISTYQKLLSIKHISIKLVLVADYEYQVKDKKSVKVDYAAEIIDHGNNEFLLIIPQSSLDSNIEDIIIHELLHIFFWKYVEKTKNLIDVMDDWHESHRSRLKEDVDNVEHLWIDKLIPLIKR